MVNATRQQIKIYRKWGFAKKLRDNPTEAEELMWNHLRQINNQLPKGVFFRRQCLVCGFIVDFLCKPAKLVLEVDGPIHQFQRQEDAHRDFTLRRFGYEVVRVTNEDVYDFRHAEAIALKMKNIVVQRNP